MEVVMSNDTIQLNMTNCVAKCNQSGEIMDKQVKKLIDEDDLNALELMTKDLNIVYGPHVFEYCSEKLAINCLPSSMLRDPKNSAIKTSCFASTLLIMQFSD